MHSLEQRPYVSSGFSEADDIFTDNPSPRCPVLLLLDTSGSMDGAPIQALNRGLMAFKTSLRADQLAARRVEVAIVSFGPVTCDVDFVSAETFEPPQLKAGGDTPMGRAIETGLDMLKRRREIYKTFKINSYRPWAFLITDGAPTDNWANAAALIRADETAKRLAFFAVGVAGADFETLGKLATREPLRLEGLRFSDLFQWLSTSLSAVSQSQPGNGSQQAPEVALPAPRGWAAV